jgi:class 3 adenylate cyclase/tetratricopeptide (TPR) repeat protein
LREKLVALEAQNQPAQQRKLATVLFADVSGFTALSETLDAEVVAGIMNDLWAAVDRAILDHGGRIDKHIGDAVMALWGAEAAREDDAERAMRGALAIQAAINEFCTISSGTHGGTEGAHGGAPLQLAMRIGVNTGPVLLGAVGSTGEFTAMGDAVNLASRLEHAAPVGGILISHDTYRHVRGVFDVLAQEPIQVKGKAEPVQTYVVQRAKPRAFRLATRGVEGIETRMVGRDHELGMLQEAYADAIESAETRVVTVVGEAGVGKSRLLYEFDNWIELRPELVTYFKGRGTPNTQNVAYSLFRDLFAFRFDIRDSDSAAVALAKFQSGMSPHIESDQAAVAGQWLGFDFSASAAVQRLLGATGFAETARAHLVRYFRNVLAEDPAVVLLEDIHWADDLSLDLVLHLSGIFPAAPLLVVALARPIFFERRPHWGEGEAAFKQLELSPLSKRCTLELLDEILQRVDEIPQAFRDLVANEAEGNPFYVEELVKMLIDQGVIEIVTSDELRVTSEEPPNSSLTTRHSSLETWRVRTDRLAGLKVPPTLTGLLQARLDGLPRRERETLQRASVIGRKFWDDAVADLLKTEQEIVAEILEAIRDRELVFHRERSSIANVDEYIFKHALLRDVAYETVLLKYRPQLHDRVARWLESHAGERINEYLGLIADHYILAGEGLRAAELLERSGSEALEVGASAPARRSLEQALALRAAGPHTHEEGMMQPSINLGRACLSQGDYEAAESSLLRGLALARVTKNEDSQAEALVWLSKIASDQGEWQLAHDRAGEALSIARCAGKPALALALWKSAGLAWKTGDLDASVTDAVESLAVARAIGDIVRETAALIMLGIISGERGDLDQAETWMKSALDLARRAGNLNWEATCLVNLGSMARDRGDFTKAESYAQAALDRFRELGIKGSAIIALINLCEARVGLGKTGAAAENAREMLVLAWSIGATPSVLASVFAFSEIAVAEGDLPRALMLLGLARAHPALEYHVRATIDGMIARLDLPTEEIEARLAAGAALDFEAVVQEILDGEWSGRPPVVAL